VKDDTEKSSYQTVPALSRTYCDPKKSYIITGGLGGVGLELSQWLIDRGAKTLVLTSRSGIMRGYQARKLKKWRRKGIRVEVSSLDIVDNSTTYQLVKKTNDIGPVGGVVHWQW
jgi:fatty acid synthase